MWIKLCGVQTVSRARRLAELDMDAVGINRYEPSSRYVGRQRAKELADTIRSESSSVDVVGVYVNPDEKILREDHEQIEWDIIQLHGDESPEFSERIGSMARVLKAFSVDKDFSRNRLEPYDTWATLLDAYHPDQYGGTGRTLDWEGIKTLFADHRVVLSGGLNPDNVARAIEVTGPFGVDACSGVEDPEGFKDLTLARSFVQAVRSLPDE